jgi:hypothetical protein
MEKMRTVNLLLLAIGLFAAFCVQVKAQEISYINQFPLIEQPDQISCGPTSCSMVLGYYGISAGIGPLKTAAGTRWYSDQFGNRVGLTLPSGIEEVSWLSGFCSVYPRTRGKIFCSPPP